MSLSDQIHQVSAKLDYLRKLKSDNTPYSDSLRAECDEVMETWAPLAERIGLEHEQQEMLDLAVSLGYPEDYKELKRLLLESEMMCENVFTTFALPIRAMLDSLGIEYDFKYRMKSVYSIWRKMRVDHKQFDDVYDLFASRIIYKPKPIPADCMVPTAIDSEPDVAAVKPQGIQAMDPEHYWCWRIYTILVMLYRIHPDRIKNWVTYPKPSGYQALQLTVMGPDCNWIEIQIRSERMHYEAEEGIAAHWKYKEETATK